MLRVVLIDDEDDALDLLEILLGKIGDVTIVGRYSDPVHALEAVKKSIPDVVFMDIEMPKIKGTQLARQIKEMNVQIMIVFTTAYSDYAVEAFEIQTHDYLLKPFSLDRLSMCLSRIRTSIAERPIRLDQKTECFIQCMGGFTIYLSENNEDVLQWKTNKEKEVCAFLIHHAKKPVDSDLMITSIWPNHDLVKAKNYLYTCLSYLRKDLSEHNIPAQIKKAGKGFTFIATNLAQDIEQFSKLAQSILTKEQILEEDYRQFVSLYRGTYMEGCDYSWASAKQIELSERYIQTLRKLHAYFQSIHNAELEEDSLKRIVELLPDSEQDGRALIRFYMKHEKRNEAIHVFHRLGEFVHKHIGISLEQETLQLFEEIVSTKR
ncbi:response regulator [Sporolactobacillus laevolacticus]|uniref:response regulator n=1 Tax=Sporolactobacillus laevolacticus TaxID=33018 RepID=UPI0025B2D1A4|nr:response regulator [Sporolactobacillus laevolacticus]MDN3954905.1 response regulator [Sporolactobacillus laevolacticus]